VALSWVISSNVITVQATFANHFGWAGIGWHAPSNDTTLQKMSNANFAIAQFSASGKLTSVGDFVSSSDNDGFDDPQAQTPSGLIATSGFSDPVTSTTTFSFTRKLVSGIPGDIDFAAGMVEVIWARGQKNQTTLAYHGPGNAGSFRLNFFSGAAAPVNSGIGWMVQLHAVLMVSAFIVLMPFGIFVATYLKAFWWWFPLHVMVMSIALLTALGAFIIALLMTVGGHFLSWHAKIGLATLCLSSIAPVLGVLADRLWDPDRKGPPLWPDVIHWWTGRLSVAGAATAIMFAVAMLGFSPVLYAAFGGVLACYLLIYFGVFAMRKAGVTVDDEGNQREALLKEH
jgi:hypothetical protein